jgi:hypothetical protein
VVGVISHVIKLNIVMNKLKLISPYIIGVLLVFGIAFTVGNEAYAAASSTTSSSTCSGTTQFCNPLRFDSVEGFLTNVLVTIRQIIVLLALVFMVVGAFIYVTSAGEKDSIEKAKKTMTSAMIGLALGIAAPSFLKEIGNVLGWSSTSNAEVAAAPTLSMIATNVLNFLLSTLGIVALVMMILGATMYVTAAGDEDRVDSGKNMFKYSLIGVLLAMGSMVLLRQIAVFFS